MRYTRPQPKQETVQSATSRLKHLLMNCTDKALAGFTVDQIASFHRVPVQVAEYELTIARQRRAEPIEAVAERLHGGTE